MFTESILGPFHLKNRLFRSATNEHLSDKEGNLTPELMAAYEEVARGGAALLFTGHYSIDRDCRADPGQPVMDEALNAGLVGPMVENVHRQGCYVLAQISHPGPKALVCKNGQRAKKAPEYTPEELARLRVQFIEGARVAKAAGFDGVQVHLAHGYCLSGFLDPAENTRTDGYGGEKVEDRFRLVGEILEGIRAVCGPGFPVAVKLNCNCGDPGRDYTEDLGRVLALCKEAGVFLAEVSGLDFAALPADYDRPYYLDAVKKVARPAGLPLALVGGLDSRPKLEEALAAGVEYCSLSRALICEPDLIDRLAAGQAEKGACLRCKGCYQCYRTRHTRCVLHSGEIPRLRENFG